MSTEEEVEIFDIRLSAWVLSMETGRARKERVEGGGSWEKVESWWVMAMEMGMIDRL